MAERWTRWHRAALDYFTPSSLNPKVASSSEKGTENEEELMKAHALINLQLALIPLTILFMIVVIFVDGTFLTDSVFIFNLSLCVYAANLWSYRRWGNLFVAAMLLTTYLEHAIMFKAFVEGMHSESYFWVVLLPQMFFYLLGSRSGLICLGLTFIHTIFIYLHQFGIDGSFMILVRVTGIEDMKIMPVTTSPWMPSSLVLSRACESPHGIFFNRIALLLFVSSMSYLHESHRSLALRRVEDALREKEAVNAGLLQATEAKTHFLANMSHELRTPMHGIIAMASDLKEMPLTSKAREALGIISDCADHLLSLVNDVLDFARIEQSQLELEQIPFCVTSEVKKALAMHTVMAKQKGVYLLVKKVRVSHPYHIGDPLRFRQIVINLLSNALKFTPGGGQVSLSLVNKKDQPALIRVSVRDTGIGIPKSSQPHLFESFSQLDASIRRKYGGSGLGLSICKKLCSAMGGDIFCNSEVGKGSEFSFVVNLPPTTKQSYREAREVDEGASARNRNVHQHQHNHRNHRHFRDQSSAAQSEDEENEELMKLESDIDIDESTKPEQRSQSENSFTDSDSDSDSSDDSSEKDTESDLEDDDQNGPANEHFMTKSLTLTPVRRRTMPNLSGHGNQKQAIDRKRKSIHGRDAIIASADRHLHQSIARAKSQQRRRSEGGTYLLHANPLGSSGRGYSAESETDHDEAEAWCSSDFTASNSASTLSRVSLTSPSSSFCSFSDTPLSTPSGQSSDTLDIANDIPKSSDVPTYLESSMAHNIDSQRRSSAPSLEGVASRTRKMSQQHNSMPTIPSLQSASTSPLNSPTLHPLPSGYQATPPSSPMFQASAPSVVSSSITTLASSTHLVSLNSCSSPRGVMRKRTVTPPSYLRHAEQSATASHSGTSRPVPPLNLAKVSSSPRGAANRASTSPRSFYVPSFPLVSPRSVAEHSRTSASGPHSGTGDERKEILRGKSILIVEDNIINQKVALKMLSTFECKTTVAENGLVAIKLFEESCRERRRRNDKEPPYHAILMDIQMPFIDGFETAVRIREIEAHLRDSAMEYNQELDLSARMMVPIIALTASATREYQQMCKDKGMNCFLSKPLKKETLVRTLVDVIKQAGYHDSVAAQARKRAAEEERTAREQQMKRQRDELSMRRQRKAREEATLAMAMMMRRPMLATTDTHGFEDEEPSDTDLDPATPASEMFRPRGNRMQRHVRHNSIG